jgi:hypothetical protein
MHAVGKHMYMGIASFGFDVPNPLVPNRSDKATK